MEMRELLSDNITLLNRFESFGGNPAYSSLPGSVRPRMREISSITLWLYCYIAYVAMCSPDPTTRHMLAYGRLILKKSLKHPGSAWMEYDRVFWASSH